MDKKNEYDLTLKKEITNLTGGSRTQDVIFLLLISFIAVAALSVSVYNFEDGRHKTTDTFSTITMEGSGGTGSGSVSAKGKTNLTFTADTGMSITGSGTNKKITFLNTGSGSGSPGGSDTQVQFNDGGSTFGGDSGLTYNKTTDTLTSTNLTVTTQLTASGLAYPTSAGSNGQVLTTNGLDTLTFTSATASSIDGLSDASAGGANFTNSIGLGQTYSPSSASEGNTILGIGAMSSLNGGDNNTVIGYNSGTTITTGSNNTVIGNGAEASSATISNEITLGNSAVDKIRAGVATLTTLSDGRDKIDVSETQFGLDFLEKLKPVDYTWKRRILGSNDIGHPKNGTRQTGFIAQDLLEALGDDRNEILDLVYKSNPERYEVSYGNLIPVLVKSIQDLSKKVKKLEKK